MSDVLGHHSHRGQQGDGLEDRLDVVFDTGPDRETVGEEHRVELAAFGDLREFLEVRHIEDPVGLGARVPPRRFVVSDSHQECVEVELLRRLGHDYLTDDENGTDDGTITTARHASARVGARL